MGGRALKAAAPLCSQPALAAGLPAALRSSKKQKTTAHPHDSRSPFHALGPAMAAAIILKKRLMMKRRRRLDGEDHEEDDDADDQGNIFGIDENTTAADAANAILGGVYVSPRSRARQEELENSRNRFWRYQPQVYRFYNHPVVQGCVAVIIVCNFVLTIAEREIDAFPKEQKRYRDLWEGGDTTFERHLLRTPTHQLPDSRPAAAAVHHQHAPAEPSAARTEHTYAIREMLFLRQATTAAWRAVLASEAADVQYPTGESDQCLDQQ